MAVLDILCALLLAASVLVLLPAALLFVEIVAAVVPGRKPAPESRSEPSLAVLVPAHDEALVIGETLRGISSQLSPKDRLVVIADNCTDDTAQIAGAHGAEVISRSDAAKRGKSYALDFGIRHLAKAPPDVVAIVDADCALDPGALRRIGTTAHDTGRPVQAHYEFLSPVPDPSPRLALAVFAAKVKNYLRSLGYSRLGLPCQLAGTGMAFPWTTLVKVDLGTGELAEDLVLGLDLARLGHAPLFCPEARVTSTFPVSDEGSKTQRARWEAGHLTTIFRRVPKLVLEAIATLNLPLLALALDAAVPPLALYATALAGIFAASLLAAMLGAFTPVLVSGAAVALFGLSIVLAWNSVGRDNVTLADLAAIPAYAFSKMPLYAQIFGGKRISWVRSKRD